MGYPKNSKPPTQTTSDPLAEKLLLYQHFWCAALSSGTAWCAGAGCADLPVRCFCKQLGGNTVDLRPQGSRLPEKKNRREARLDYVEDTLESQGQGIKTLEKIFLREEDRRTKRMGREERLSEPNEEKKRREPERDPRGESAFNGKAARLTLRSA